MTAFNESLSLLPGTLDLLILRTLGGGGPMHGYGIAERLRTVSDDVLQVGRGALANVFENTQGIVRGQLFVVSCSAKSRANLS